MIQSSELILNPDGSVYHLNLKPEHIAHNIILWAIKIVSKKSHNFDSIEFSTQKRIQTQTDCSKARELVSCQQE
jgi:uridine phosphorylase